MSSSSFKEEVKTSFYFYLEDIEEHKKQRIIATKNM